MEPTKLPVDLEIVELDDRLDMSIDLINPGAAGLDTCCTPSNNCSCCNQN